MTMTTTDAARAVTQVDREAAAANIKRRLVWQHGGEQPWIDASTASMRMGEQDDHDEVQAFARHRLAERERCAKVADEDARTSREMYEAAAKDSDSVGLLVHAEAQHIGVQIAAAIRETNDVG